MRASTDGKGASRTTGKPWKQYGASSGSTTAGGPTTASDCRRPTTYTGRPESRERCGRTKFIPAMSRVCRLINNFAAGKFPCCQLFQENVNLFRKGVNQFRKMTTKSGKQVSTTSGKSKKTVNQNQEKTICP